MHPQHVEVKVELLVLEKLNVAGIGDALPSSLVFANRLTIENAARRIINREGPNFLEPVRVTVNDL